MNTDDFTLVYTDVTRQQFVCEHRDCPERHPWTPATVRVTTPSSVLRPHTYYCAAHDPRRTTMSETNGNITTRSREKVVTIVEPDHLELSIKFYTATDAQNYLNELTHLNHPSFSEQGFALRNFIRERHANDLD